MKTQHQGFWREWQNEQEHFWESLNNGKRSYHGSHFSGPELARAWRNFFHDFMGAWPEGSASLVKKRPCSTT